MSETQNRPHNVNVPVERDDLEVIREAARSEKRSIRSQCAFVLSQYAAEQAQNVQAVA